MGCTPPLPSGLKLYSFRTECPCRWWEGELHSGQSYGMGMWDRYRMCRVDGMCGLWCLCIPLKCIRLACRGRTASVRCRSRHSQQQISSICPATYCSTAYTSAAGRPLLHKKSHLDILCNFGMHRGIAQQDSNHTPMKQGYHRSISKLPLSLESPDLDQNCFHIEPWLWCHVGRVH